MKAICFVVFFMFASQFVGSSGKDDKGEINITQLRLDERNEVKSELNDTLLDTVNDANRSDASCNCGPYGECKLINGDKNCTCVTGYKEYYGYCKECDCAFGECSFTTYGSKKCDCDDGYAEYEKKCQACDCGKNHTCKVLSRSTKQCLCKEGLREINGKCQECDCGSNSEYCEYDDFSRKKCTCKAGYQAYRKKSWSDDECLECNCVFGECSIISYGSVKCDCDDGYVQYQKKCQACDCGKNQTCNFSGGKKQCLCSEGLREINGKCQECDCGSNSEYCEYDEFRRKKCTCKAGYYARRRDSWSDDECLDCGCGKQEKCAIRSNGEKVCLCSKGLKEIKGKCQECDCGRNAEYCEYDSFRGRKCTCKTGFYHTSTSQDECFDCNCGTHSIGCYADKQDRRVCICQYGTVKNESFHRCRECDCGVGEKSCTIVWNGRNLKRVCSCHSEYRPVVVVRNGNFDDEHCEPKACYCGIGGKTCSHSVSGKLQCTCYSGYEVINVNSAGEYCIKKTVTIVESSYAWIWVLYFIPPIIAIFFGILLCLCCRRMKKTPKKNENELQQRN